MDGYGDGEVFEFVLGVNGAAEGMEVSESLATGDEAKAGIGLGEGGEEVAQVGIEEASGLGVAGWLLQGFEAGEDDEAALLTDEVGEAAAFAGEIGIRIAEEDEGLLEEVADAAGAGLGAVGEGAGALVVEGPVEVSVKGGLAVVGLPVLFDEACLHPFSDEGRLADTAPGNDGEDVGAIGPGFIEQGELGFASKEVLGGVVDESGWREALALRFGADVV